MAGQVGLDVLRAGLVQGGGDAGDYRDLNRQPLSPVPPKYMYNGQVYNNLDEVRQAMAGGGQAVQAVGRSDTAGTLKRIQSLLEDGDRFERTVSQLFKGYAGSDGKLQVHEMKGLTGLLSAKIGIDASFFENTDAMFYRFDHDGSGSLELPETMDLIKFLLKSQERILAPRDEHTLLHLPRKDLKKAFTLGKKLGQGGQGAVYLAKDNQTGTSRVVKFYDKSGGNSCLEDIKDEFELLKRLDHPNVARICEVFEDLSNIYVVSEPYTGGDLTTCTEKAQKNGVQVTHAWLGNIFVQVLRGIAYLHSHHTMHCDLKEPNAMIADDEHWSSPPVMLIDFGMAKNFSGMRAGGTPGYMPPEFWQHQLWTPKGDIFALAVTFWSIYNGKQGGPFQVPDYGPPFPNIQRATCFNQMDCSRFPPGLREIIQKMATKDFRRRPTAEQVLKDPYFQRLEAADQAQPLDTAMIGGMMRASRRSASQNMIAIQLANTKNLGQMKQLNGLFKQLDNDGDGEVERNEAITALINTGFAPEEANQVVESLMGEDGKVAYSTFMGRMIAATESLNSSTLAEVFQSIDTDGSGHLDRSEIQQLMQKKGMDDLIQGRSVDDLIAEMDLNGDGNVSFDEFRQVMLGDHVETNFSQGQEVEYYSPSNIKWIPCTITAVDGKGRVQISIKPGGWLNKDMQLGHLRTA